LIVASILFINRKLILL